MRRQETQKERERQGALGSREPLWPQEAMWRGISQENVADGRGVSVDKATDWFLEKAELQAHPSVTFHLPESLVEDLGAALGLILHTLAHRGAELRAVSCSLSAPGYLACLIMGLPHCSLSACLFFLDWHSQPSADSLKLGLQPCSLSSAPDPPTQKPLATPDHPRLAAPSNGLCKARWPLSPWTRPPILDSRHCGLGAAGTSESTRPGLKAASSFSGKPGSSLLILFSAWISLSLGLPRGLRLSLSSDLAWITARVPSGAPSHHLCCHRDARVLGTHSPFVQFSWWLHREKLYPFLGT